jgi:hypothetical protein
MVTARPVEKNKDEKHYSLKLAEAIYWFLTLGTIIRFMREVASSYIILRILDWLIVLGGVSQVLAGLFFIYNMWTRVRPVGKQT